ncbi:glycosyltransferase [Demequina gelatinilytica]|uniref:glycosyltransferase n=1 Tax=Demequina gelatinilytica TaxID=1638980 RepID=UPI001470638C|nr:glycosyltransferase [Demequina gelatinilytica]
MVHGMQDAPLRILHLMGPLRPSGMERMLVSAAPYWPAHTAHVVVGQGDDHPFAPELEAAGYELDTIPSIRVRAGVDALRRAVANHRADVVHIHTEGAYINAVRGSRDASAIVRTIHNVFPVTGKASWSRRAQALLGDRRVEALVAPSPDVASQERALGRECEVVYNWVADDFSDVADVQSPTRHAVIVGNMSPIKNHVLALEALVGSGIPLALVGDTSGASPREQELLAQLDRDGLLLHCGPGDPIPWLSGAGVYLMPSRHEGMGVALAEALTVGVPCVISDVPGLRWAADLVGVTSLPLDVRRWRQALTLALAQGRTHDRAHPDFSASRGAREYAGVYARVVGGARSAASA